MKKRLLAFFLALGILLSGCTVAGPAPTTVPTETTQATTEATQPTAPTEPEITHPALKFDELEYVHPDLDALNAKIDEAIAMASESGKEAELLNLYQEIQDDYVNYSTMATLASIHNYLDLQDEYYEKEYLDLDAAGTKLDNRLNDLTGGHSGFRVRRRCPERLGGGLRGALRVPQQAEFQVHRDPVRAGAGAGDGV